MTTGSYAIERDYSHYIAYASKTVLAIVGTATKGPIGVPTVCTSATDFVNKFGPLNVNCMGLYAGQYFLSKASKMYYVRAAGDSAAEASITVSGVEVAPPAGGSGDPDEDPVESALTIKVLEKGTHYNGYTLKIEATTTGNKYNLTLKNAKSTTIEVVAGVSFDELIVGYKTKYFQVTAKSEDADKLTAETYTFAGGNNGLSDIDAADYINAASTLALESIDINLISVPGVSDASVVHSVLALAENRGDCLYLVDPPSGLDRDEVIQWVNGEGTYTHTKFDSSYGAVYYNWVIIYDSVNAMRIEVPPSVVAAATYAYSDRLAEVWFAPAGLNRGIVSGVTEVLTQLSKADVDYLYENNINSLYEDAQKGLVLWGQKTLWRSDTALNRINVRRLLNYLKKVVVAACNYMTFEPNDRLTWNSFQMKVKPLLDGINTKRGIYDYKIVKGASIVTDDDIDNYRMPCMIMIKPTKTAEEIPIYFVITSTGADFNEVLEENGVVSTD